MDDAHAGLPALVYARALNGQGARCLAERPMGHMIDPFLMADKDTPGRVVVLF